MTIRTIAIAAMMSTTMVAGAAHAEKVLRWTSQEMPLRWTRWARTKAPPRP